MHYIYGVIGWLLMVSSFGLPAQAASSEEQAAAETTYVENIRLYPQSAEMAARGLHIAYVEADSSPGGGRYVCGGMNEKQIASGAKIVTLVLNALPVQAWQKIDIQYILLCSTAKANGRVIGGIPVPPAKLLMLNAGVAPSAKSRFPLTIMHELFHAIEMQYGSYQDAAWDAQFSGYDNSYGAQAGATTMGSGGAGFINGYGKSFSHEERAELFAMQILTRKSLSQYIANKDDKKLEKKQRYIVDKCNQLLGAGSCI